MSLRRRACLTGALIGALSLPPVVVSAEPVGRLRSPNLRPQLNSSEAGLWDDADKAEAHVKQSAELDRDAALTDYVRQVICKVAAEYCGELRVYVLDRPFFNAQAAPNGYVEVFSGLLLRARTEDELAFVLGHETTHFARNHTLARLGATEAKANMMLAVQTVITLGAAAAMYSAASTGAPNAGNSMNSISQAARSLNDLVYLSTLASLYAYDREQESEADKLGYQRAVSAGYDRAASVAMWTDVLEESKASDFPKTRVSAARASIFDTHPLEVDRIAALKSLGATVGEPDVAAQKRYRAAIRPHLAAWLKDDLRRRDYGQSLYVIDRLSALGEDRGVLEFYRGEAHRQRRGPGDVEASLAAYRAAASASDAPVEVWRELGDALRKSGDGAGAANAYRNYVDRAPQAEDRWLIEANLKTLGGVSQ